MQNSKLDKMIEPLIEGMSAKELWHLVFNKMTNPAKRQMIGEMMNSILGSGYTNNGNIFANVPHSKEMKSNEDKLCTFGSKGQSCKHSFLKATDFDTYCCKGGQKCPFAEEETIGVGIDYGTEAKN